jgi:hypothetical protein
VAVFTSFILFTCRFSSSCSADSLRQNTSVDWSSRDSVRAKLRLLVKRILSK